MLTPEQLLYLETLLPALKQAVRFFNELGFGNLKSQHLLKYIQDPFAVTSVYYTRAVTIARVKENQTLQSKMSSQDFRKIISACEKVKYLDYQNLLLKMQNQDTADIFSKMQLH